MNYSEFSEGISICDLSHTATTVISTFSFLDDTQSAFKALSNVADAYCHQDVKKCEFKFSEIEEGSRRFCYDLAPFMILDKLSTTSEKTTIIDIEDHESLKKVLCSLKMRGLVSECSCSDPLHGEVYPVPTIWYNPNNFDDTPERTESMVCQANISDAIKSFSHQVEAFNLAYPLSEKDHDELILLESHLEEILSNCSHARGENGESGEWGFSCFLAKRDDTLFCNICVITLGRTLSESLNSDTSVVKFATMPMSDESPAQHDLTEPLMIFGVIDTGPSSTRGFQSGGLHNFFVTTQELSSKLDVSVISGKGMVSRRKGKGEPHNDLLIVPGVETPGTIISVRFEVDL